MRNLHDPDKSTSFAIIFQNPYKIFVRKPVCQFAAVIIAICLIFFAAKNGMEVYSYGVSRSQFLKMTVSTLYGMETRGLSLDAISDLQFTRAGCYVLRAPNVSTEDSDKEMALRIQFPSPTELDGVAITLNKSCQCDAIRFLVSGSTDPVLGWRTVASSAFRKRKSGIQFYQRHIPCSKRKIVLDYRAPWPLTCVGVVQPTFQALSCIAFALAGFTNRERNGSLLIGISLLLLVLITAASAVGFVLLGDGKESIVPFLSSISYLALVSSLRFAPSLLIDTVAATSCAMLLARIACDCALQDPGNLAADPPVILLLCAAASTCFLAARRRFIARAVRDVGPDRELHDRAWADHAAADAAADAALRPALVHLHASVARVRDSCGAERPRQLNRRRLCPPDGRADPAAPAPAFASAPLSWGFIRRASSSGSAAGSEAAGPDGRSAGEAAWSFLLRRASSSGSAASAGADAGRRVAGGPARGGLADPRALTATGEWDAGRPVDSLDQLYAQAARWLHTHLQHASGVPVAGSTFMCIFVLYILFASVYSIYCSAARRPSPRPSCCAPAAGTGPRRRGGGCALRAAAAGRGGRAVRRRRTAAVPARPR